MIASLCALALAGVPDYEALRRERAEGLASERGWLTVAALDWLAEGENLVGSSPTAAVRLPDRVPAEVGVLTRKGRVVTFRRTGESEEIATDKPIDVEDLSFAVIERGDRMGVRLWDPQAPARRQFRGLRWYPVDPQYRVMARYVRYAKPRTLAIRNILGDTNPVKSSGYVRFTLGGKAHRLQAEDEGPMLFINFQDATSGRTTYGAGRFLYAPKPSGDYVMLDFNLAVNPPCNYTDFATCPLPPPGNRLALPVEAGEKTYVRPTPKTK